MTAKVPPFPPADLVCSLLRQLWQVRAFGSRFRRDVGVVRFGVSPVVHGDWRGTAVRQAGGAAVGNAAKQHSGHRRGRRRRRKKTAGPWQPEWSGKPRACGGKPQPGAQAKPQAAPATSPIEKLDPTEKKRSRVFEADWGELDLVARVYEG